MPELPEVETMRRGIATIAGSRIAEIVRPSSHLQSIAISPNWPTFRRRALDRRIEEVGRLGKRIVLLLESDERLVIEPRMTGLIMLADPPNESHLRMRFLLRGGKAKELLFWDQRGLGVVRLLTARQYAEELGPKRIGPDALEATAELLHALFGKCKGPIKPALMDQSRLAGIGNLYASEILHLAKIHPAARANSLRPSDWNRVADAMREILTAAIAHQGSTLRDGTYRIARDEPGNFQACHRVYQRAGEKCLQCGKGEILRIIQSQRSTFFCPRCQL